MLTTLCRTLAATALALLVSSCAAQGTPGWIVVDDPAQLRWLMSDKTFRGVSGEGVSYVNYYRADGTGLLIYKGSRIPRTWRIEGSTVCVTDPRETNCYRMQRNPENPREFISQHALQGWSNRFNVEDGVPAF
jgi:hypothetical protein